MCPGAACGCCHFWTDDVCKKVEEGALAPVRKPQEGHNQSGTPPVIPFPASSLGERNSRQTPAIPCPASSLGGRDSGLATSWYRKPPGPPNKVGTSLSEVSTTDSESEKSQETCTNKYDSPVAGAGRKKGSPPKDAENSSEDSSSEAGSDSKSGTESGKSIPLPVIEGEVEITGWETSKDDISWKTHNLVSCHNASGNLLARISGVAGRGKRQYWNKRKIFAWVETHHKTGDDFGILEEDGGAVYEIARPDNVKGGGLVVRIHPDWKDQCKVEIVGTWRITVVRTVDGTTETYDFMYVIPTGQSQRSDFILKKGTVH